MEMTARSVPRQSTTTPLRLPLSLLLSGAVASVLLGSGAIFVLPEALTDPQALPVLALVHTATLGWWTMTIMGALYQLVPVVLVTRLRAVPLAYCQMLLYLAGVICLISGFWFNQTALLAGGGTLVVVAATLFAVHLLATILLAPRRPLTAAYLIAALVYLLVVVNLGLTAALNLRWGFLGATADHLLLAHLVVGLGGWLGLTVIGVSYKLVPMFALVHRRSERFGWALLILLNLGLPGLALSLGLAAPAWLVELAGGVLALGLLGFVYDFWRMLRVRQKHTIDVMQRFAIVAPGYLALGVLLGSAIAAFHLDGAFGPLWLAAAYLVLLGWIGQSILGNLQKIVPFLVWNQRYASRIGREKVPLLRDLIHQPTARLAFWLFNGGVLAEAGALALANPLAISLAEYVGQLHTENDQFDAPLLMDLLTQLGSFLTEELLPHAQGEERVLYPVLDPVIAQHGSPTATMRIDHEYITSFIQQATALAGKLRSAGRSERDLFTAQLQQVLAQLQTLLTVHLAKEERVYLPLVEQHFSPAEQQLLGELHESAEAQTPKAEDGHELLDVQAHGNKQITFYRAVGSLMRRRKNSPFL